MVIFHLAQELNKRYNITMFKNSFNRFFFRFFPAPNFFAGSSFGLDISDESLKFVELVLSGKGLSLGRYGERSIPPGVIESGKIKDSKKMEEILTALRKEAGVKSVRVSLPEEQVYLFQLRLEKMGLKNIKEGIELVLEEHVPISAEDAIFDYDLVKEDAQNLEVQVAAIPRNVIENYLSVSEHSQIRVESFELEAQALSRAVIKAGDMETYMIVDFGKKRTGIFIVSRGIVMFTSTLDVGGIALTGMIQKNFNISFEEAEKMKWQYGLERNIENKEIFAVLLNSVSVLRDEIVKHFLYWHTHQDEEANNNPPIRKIILCGGDSNLIGLADYLSVSMKSPVEMANVWTNITNVENSIPEMSFRQALSFSTALGLALGNFSDN
jgi:type IV pilus assembly protein PilM